MIRVYHRVLAALCIAAVLLLVTAAATVAATAADATARERMSDGDITVLYGPGAARVAVRVLEVAASRGRAVARQAGLLELGPVVIYVASTDEEFRALTYGGVPDWGAGCAFPERGVVVLRTPVAAPDPLRMEDVIVHEIGHIAAGRVLKRVHVPRWFHEGIAMTLAGEWRLPRSPALAGAAASGELVPLDELAVAFPAGSADAMLAYSESFYAVRFLMEEAGQATPAEILSAVAVSGSFEAGLGMLLGRTLAEFEREALASFEERFGWGVFLTRWDVMFGVVTLFALAAGAVRLARSRRLLREWEVEERARSAGGPRAGHRPDSGWN
jgi:hypothetical protein